MADHPNAELMRSGYAAFQAADMEGLRALFAPDIVWHDPGHNRFSGTVSGVDEVLAHFLAFATETGGTFHVDLHDALANDEHAVALATVSGERNGKRLSERYTQIAHFKDGRLAESWIFDENPDVVDDFWA
ncbi:MAG: nuclear transport factor 2 family protein [Candidatus Dormibacteraeota bacterium]|nr:nuclear transport factor 2 family protein [Candidatus Dormibacteraeota bacterium]